MQSAVAGINRNDKLTFEVADKIKPTIRYYRIIHETPKNVKILKGNEEISWLKLLTKDL